MIFVSLWESQCETEWLPLLGDTRKSFLGGNSEAMQAWFGHVTRHD